MTRAHQPDQQGHVERDGVKIYYEVHGDADQTVVLLPTWSIVHSRHWKMQVPYLARSYRVVTFDGRGNGRSDRPQGADAYSAAEFRDDTLAVLDDVGVEHAVFVSLSAGAIWHLLLAATEQERVQGSVFIGPALQFGPAHMARAVHRFGDVLDTTEGWAKYNRHYWMKDYRDFVEFFFGQMFNEPHSTKPREDCVNWALETTPETLIDTIDAIRPHGENTDTVAMVRALCDLLREPVLVIHGDQDAITPHEWGAELAKATGGTLLTLEGSGHGPHVRDPVRVNAAIKDFVESIAPAPAPVQRWVRGKSRRKRALYISSPIGLGHAQRDVAIARELRNLHPDLEIDWLAQHPVTAVLEANGEHVHPASAYLANESQHIESESAEHDLHCFQAWRNMDEILLANYMVFRDAVAGGDYDLWIGDEAWELDYYLHENPEEKRAAYCWLTDFVGWLPMADGGEHEAYLTADYNAEMIEHIAVPAFRDRAIFVGDREDIVTDRFGAGLPAIRDWTEDHFDFAGYVTGFDPISASGRDELRDELGFAAEERVCIVAVGGSGVGAHLLRRAIAAYPEAKARVPELRMIVVAGPRIDPASLPHADGLEVRAFVPNLYRHLGACDIAVVQGGLTTAMELTANRRPFLYFPLRHHFEQNFHVRHRLDRYQAGRCMDFATATPESLASAIADELDRPVEYRPVDTDGAARAASRIAELL